MSTRGSGYYAEIQVGMAEKAKPLLEALKTEFGGTMTRTRKQSQDWDAAWRWRIGGAAALQFLAKIEPCLLLKREQAKTAMEINAIRETLPKMPNGSRRWTKKAREQAWKLKERINRLNLKGPDAPRVGAGFYKPMPTLFGTWEPYSEAWPRAGTIVGGTAYRRQPLAPVTRGIASGLLPTPAATQYGTSQNEGQVPHKRPSAGTPSLSTMERKGLWPTPRCNTGPSTDRRHLSLDGAVRRYPTPRCSGSSMGGDSGGRNAAKTRGDLVGGALNPTWVEWLMGAPLGWTALGPLAAAGFRSWLRRHGKL
jgi:hypothetical protein